MRLFNKFVLIILILFVLLPVEGCSKFQQSKYQETQRRKKFEKEKKQREKEAEQAYEEAIERHYMIQDKSTRQLMKKNAKKSLAYKEHKKAGVLERLFTPKQKKGKARQKGVEK
ncbi:MAG: hypothetical protein PHR81_09250 [Bacteroidales bacterium]|jgi:hypothetical protein|nr:hypothetical protein [Bacteroidales bacterium]MDD4214983.1 hypothetical protein [Bacteroidales bacterium]